MLKIQDKFFILILALLALAAIYLLSSILTPFLIGALLAYLTNPLVKKLEKFRLPRLLSVTIVFLFIFTVIILLMLLLIPMIENQINTLIASIPALTDWVHDTLMPLLDNMGVDGSRISIEGLKSVLVQNWAKAGGLANWVFATMLQSGFRVMEWLLNLILIPVVTFYLLCDWDRFLSGLRSLLPRRMEPTIVKLTKECDEVLGAFLRGQLLVMLVLAVLYSIGLTLVGLKTGILIGAIAGLLNIVPYLGFIVGIVIASVIAFMQFGSFSVLLVCIVFVTANSIDNMFLTPKLVGNRIGLHPVAVIFAILAGGELFGFLGVLLALPAAASIMVWIRYLNQQYHKSELYKS